MTLGDSHVNRLDALIRAGLKGNMGIHGMIELLDRASKGVYKPHGYTEEETLHGLLFLWLGGSRVAELATGHLAPPAYQHSGPTLPLPRYHHPHKHQQTQR